MPQAATNLYSSPTTSTTTDGLSGLTNSGLASTVGGLAVNIGTNFLTGYLQDSALESAQRRDAAALAALNNNNYQFFRESRGEDGYSHLPLYAQDADGNPLEPILYQDYLSLYNSIADRDVSGEYESALQGFSGAIEGGTRALGDLFSGESLRREESNLREVDRQRKLGVDASRNAKIKALNEQLDQIEAEQRLSGFRGSRSGTRKLNFTTQRNANSQAASDLATTNLQHNLELQAARNNDFNRRLQYIDEPSVQGRRIAAGEDLVPAAAIGRYNQALSALERLRLPVQYFEAQGLPSTVPSLGLINALGDTGNELGGLIANYSLSGNQQPLRDYYSANVGTPYGAAGRTQYQNWLRGLVSGGYESVNDSSYNPENSTP